MVTETKELSVYQPNMTVTELRNLAMDFSKSGYFQDAREMVQAVVKIQAGRELGLGPVYSMSHIYIVKGKITVGAEVMGAMIKRTGRYDYSVKKLDNEECILEFTDSGKLSYTSKFNMEDAKRAGLIKEDSGWVKWPRAMLMSKALSQGARIVCPHVISGTYTPEDFGIEPNEQGEYQEPKTQVTVCESPAEVVTEDPPLPLSDKIANLGGVELATDRQIVKLFATGGDRGYNHEYIKSILSKHYKKESTKELTKKEVSEFIESMEQGRHIDDQGNWV